MAQKHTPEPWGVWKGDTIYAGTPKEKTRSMLRGHLGVVCEMNASDFPERQQATNARRIVACVNACQGIPTEALELHRAGGLRVLLETVLVILDEEGVGGCCSADTIRTLLAAAEGEGA